MKTLFKFLISLLVVLAVFNSCEEETFTEEDAINAIQEYETQQDSIDDARNDENYLVADSLNTNWVVLTIKVINATGDFSTKGHSGATVTINVDGETISETTGTDGAAHFTGLKTGNYAVNISMTGFTTVDFVTQTDSYGYYSVQVPILSTTTNLMTVTGTVTCETDLLNTSREPASNVTVVAQPDLPDYFGSIPGVSEISYSGYTNTTTTDASGDYSIDVPADKAGELDYDIFVPVFEANQTLMLEVLDGVDVTGDGNSAQTVTTRFGTELAGSESPVPAVNPVYCVFSDPTHVFTPAELTVELDDANTGLVDKAYVSDAGADYYDLGGKPRVVIENDNPDGTDAVVELNVHNATGQIEWIEVISGGSDFQSTPDLDLSFIQRNCAIEVTAVDVDGAITGYDLNVRGDFLTNELTVVGGNGTGAEFTVVWDAVNHNYEVSGFDDTGEDYQVGDELSAAAPTTPATGYVTMGTPEVSSIQVTNQGAGYEINSTYDVNFSYGDATATAYSDAYGRIYRVDVTDGSYNYTTTPEATVDYNLINKTATASVFVQDGEVKSLFNTDGGAGYDNLPTITFHSQYETGNPAVTVDYDVTINGGDPYNVTGVTINNSPTDIKENLSTKTGDPAQNNVESIPGGTIYADFYLGTGVRTAGN
ncbi:MAG: carboxypeptidase-like regulatory domain-containing protein [Bacteroidales bacterium]